MIYKYILGLTSLFLLELGRTADNLTLRVATGQVCGGVNVMQVLNLSLKPFFFFQASNNYYSHFLCVQLGSVDDSGVRKSESVCCYSHLVNLLYTDNKVTE